AEERRALRDTQTDALFVLVEIEVAAVKDHAGEIPARAMAGEQVLDDRVVLMHPGVQLRAVSTKPAAGDRAVRELVRVHERRHELVEDAAVEAAAQEHTLR